MGRAEQHIGAADLHIHTDASDGFASVYEVLSHIEHHTTLDVIAITDHDVMDASLWAYEHRHEYSFDIIPGVEVSSKEGHILALWVTQPILRDMSLVDTVKAIHDRGGTAVLAHPFEAAVAPGPAWCYFNHPEVLLEASIDAIEVHNGGSFTPFANRLARRMAHKLGLPVLSNSDAHSPQAIGCGTTRFKGQSALDLRHALTNGETIPERGVSWPIIDYLKLLPGTTLRKLHLSSETNAT